MLFSDVAATSLNVAGTSSRLAKVTHIAELSHRATPDAESVAVVVSLPFGELPQRQIGVGWASLRQRPAPGPHPVLTVTDVDTTSSEIGAVSGKGAQRRCAELVAGLSVTEALERHGGTTLFEAKLDGARMQVHRAR